MVGYVISILLLPVLAVLASLSPLLTLAWLWQIKEWRWDRMLEHLERTGAWAQITGRVRPGIFAFFLLGVSAAGKEWTDVAVLTALCVFALATLVQMLLHRQRYPVLTAKALMILTIAGALTVLIMFAIVLSGYGATLPAVVLFLHAATLPVAWILVYPVDVFLKRNIIRHARRLREAHPDLTVIGVTGSVGKSTTKELLACVLKDLKPAVTPAHVNSEIGVAQWLNAQLTTHSSQLLIAEVGAYRRGEIALMCTYLRPSLGVVTHVGTQHIALFGSQQNLFDAKSELVRALPQDGRAFLNGDNALCRKMASLSPCPVTMVGTGGSCDLEAFDIEETPRGIRFRARDILFDVPLHGTHNITNVLLALAVGEHLGIALERMREHLRSFTPLSQTFTVREESGVRILDDTHNSSVASVKAAIAWARTQPEEHKILLAAGLIEMGDLQSPAEQELGALAGKVFTRIIVIDPQSARNFAAGTDKNIEAFSSATTRIPSGSLLVCAGRMSPAVIAHLLPS